MLRAREDLNLAAVVKAVENKFGIISTSAYQEIIALVDCFPFEWIMGAIELAAAQGRPRVKYVTLGGYGNTNPGILTDLNALVLNLNTRLLIWRGEWFMDTSFGVPYLTDVLGNNTHYDFEIKNVILTTPGVTGILNYSSSISTSRQLSISADITTIYGTTTIIIGP